MPYLGRMSIETTWTIPRFTVGDRLRKAREMTGLDQGAFAAELGVSRNTVSNAEQGRTRPRLLMLRAWSLRTGVPVEWLETGVENPRPGVPDGGDVRHQGLEPRTHWFGASPAREADVVELSTWRDDEQAAA